MFGHKKVKTKTDGEAKRDILESIDYVICPYCLKKITNGTDSVLMIFPYGDRSTLIGCPHCKRVLGTAFEF